MSVTCAIQTTVTANGVSPVSGTESETGQAVTTIDTNFAAGTNNQVVSVAFAAAALQLVELVSDQPMTVTTNGTDEVQQIATTGTVTAGTFTVTFGASTSAAIQWNATASAVQTALQAMTSIGSGNVLCGGGPLPATPVTLTFVGTLANTNVAQVTTTDTLTGGSTAVSTTTGGVAPGNTFSLKAGMPLVWGISAGYFTNPFTVDVVRFNVTCTASARLQGKVLTN